MNAKYLDITAKPDYIHVIDAHFFKHPFLVLEVGDEKVILVKKRKITQLLKFLNIGVRDFYREWKEYGNDIITHKLNKSIDQLTQPLQFNCSLYQNEWWCFRVAAQETQIITHREVYDIVSKHASYLKSISPQVILEESQLGTVSIWHIYLSKFSNRDDFTTQITVTGGRNIKTRALKVIPLVKVASCDNSIRPIEYFRIKHTKNWRNRLISAINKSTELLTNIEKTIELAQNTSTTEQDAINWINQEIYNNLNISNDKKEVIISAINRRLRHEFSQHKDNYSLSQAVTYIARHPDETHVSDDVSTKALEQLEHIGFKALNR